MAYTQLKPPIGTTAILNNRRGTNNEIAIDSTTKEFVIYDGSTLGGIRMARNDLVADLATEVKNLADAVNSLVTRFDDYLSDYNEIANPSNNNS